MNREIEILGNHSKKLQQKRKELLEYNDHEMQASLVFTMTEVANLELEIKEMDWAISFLLNRNYSCPKCNSNALEIKFFDCNNCGYTFEK